MIELCESCGQNCAEGEVDLVTSKIACPHCDHLQVFRQLHVFIVIGASGTGKSTLARALSLREQRPSAVYLDSDMLLVKGLADDGWPAYRNTWLWVCANIQQSVLPVVLFGSASIEDFENAPRKKLFTQIHCLALVCDDDVLRGRLMARPEWRRSSREPLLTNQIKWNRSLRDHFDPSEIAYDTLYTSRLNLDKTCAAVGDWVAEGLATP